MNEKTEELNYEKKCELLRLQLEEQAHEFMNKIDSIKNEKNMIIENQMKEIEFYKNIIKKILHF